MKQHSVLIFFIKCLLTLALLIPSIAYSSNFETLTSQLITKDFNKKIRLVEQLSSVDDQRVVLVFKAMLDSNLYYEKENKHIGFISINSENNKYQLTSIYDQSLTEYEKKRSLKKISTNNALKKQLKVALGRIQITSQDSNIRLNAATAMLREPNQDNLSLLQRALEQENNLQIKNVLRLNIALIQINSDNQTEQLYSIDILKNSLHIQARNALTGIIDTSSENSAVQLQAIKAIDSINGQLELYKISENIFFGISLGSVLLLSAIGLAITFGVMGVINMAHGEMMMIGAYTTFVVQQLMGNHIGASIIVAIPIAFLVTALVGIAIERGIIQFLYGRPLETLLATFGVSLFLQQLARSLFGALNQPVITPQWMSGSWQINEAFALTYNRIYIILFAIFVFLTLLLILKRTFFGLQMRAVTQNRKMARSMGIRSNWVDALTFGLGSGVAGVAGVALSQITNVGPSMGQEYIIDSFMIVVFGGVGNLWGTLVAALSLGIANKFMEPFTGAVLAKVFILVFIILFIQKRPRGLFALKGRAVEN